MVICLGMLSLMFLLVVHRSSWGKEPPTHKLQDCDFSTQLQATRQVFFLYIYFFEWPQEIIWHKILIYLLKPSLYSVISYKPSTLIHSHIPAIPLAGTDNQVVYKLLTDFTVAFTTPQFHLQLHSNDFVVLLLQFLRNGKCNEAKINK